MFCKQTIDNFLKASQNKRIVLWGAGKYVQEIVEKYNNIECIIDSDSEKWGTKCCSLKIYSPEHLYALSPNEHIIYVTTVGNTYGIAKIIKQVEDFEVFYHGVISDKFLSIFQICYMIIMKELKMLKEIWQMISLKRYTENVCAEGL